MCNNISTPFFFFAAKSLTEISHTHCLNFLMFILHQAIETHFQGQSSNWLLSHSSLQQNPFRLSLKSQINVPCFTIPDSHQPPLTLFLHHSSLSLRESSSLRSITYWQTLISTLPDKSTLSVSKYFPTTIHHQSILLSDFNITRIIPISHLSYLTTTMNVFFFFFLHHH